MMRRAAGEAAKRGVLVMLAGALVVLLGLVVFNNDDPRLPDWAWRVAVTLELAR